LEEKMSIEECFVVLLRPVYEKYGEGSIEEFVERFLQTDGVISIKMPTWLAEIIEERDELPVEDLPRPCLDGDVDFIYSSFIKSTSNQYPWRKIKMSIEEAFAFCLRPIWEKYGDCKLNEFIEKFLATGGKINIQMPTWLAERVVEKNNELSVEDPMPPLFR
jgi:hypothetical protein